MLYRYQIGDLLFEWDSKKAANVKRRQGVSFEEAALVFFDEDRYEEYDGEHSATEHRFSTTGFSDRRLLTVIYTERGDVTRIINAWKATYQEHMEYIQRKNVMRKREKRTIYITKEQYEQNIAEGADPRHALKPGRHNIYFGGHPWSKTSKRVRQMLARNPGKKKKA
jgi:uncharacterized DUF497 family protein